MTTIKNSRQSNHAISSLITMALFAMFAFLMLLTVVICAQGYRSTIDQAESTATLRTALGYVEGKVRSEASNNGVRVEEIDGQTVLFLTTAYDDAVLDTAIYDYEGMLMEVFYDTSEMDFVMEDAPGQALIALHEFKAVLNGNLLVVSAKDQHGMTAQLRIDVNSKEGAGE